MNATELRERIRTSVLERDRIARGLDALLRWGMNGNNPEVVALLDRLNDAHARAFEAEFSLRGPRPWSIEGGRLTFRETS